MARINRTAELSVSETPFGKISNENSGKSVATKGLKQQPSLAEFSTGENFENYRSVGNLESPGNVACPLVRWQATAGALEQAAQLSLFPRGRFGSRCKAARVRTGIMKSSGW